MNIFEQATKQSLRFPSDRGDLTTEQLWQLPLTASRNDFDLDTVAKTVNNQLKTLAEESFVATSTNPIKPVLELKLEILKHIIAVKMQAAADAKDRAADAKDRAAKAEKRHKLVELLGKKQDAALESLTTAEIEAQLAELDK